MARFRGIKTLQEFSAVHAAFAALSTIREIPTAARSSNKAEPRVAIDTNRLERGPRRILTGRRNGLFAFTALGAERIGVIQSLLATPELHVSLLARWVSHSALTFPGDAVGRAGALCPTLWPARRHRESSPVCGYRVSGLLPW